MEPEELRNLTEQAQNGESEAQYLLAKLYAHGLAGVSENQQEASRWYYNAANHGHIEAAYKIGKRLWLGQGVDKNRDEAVKWLSQAADAGHRDAERWLAKVLTPETDLERFIRALSAESATDVKPFASAESADVKLSPIELRNHAKQSEADYQRRKDALYEHLTEELSQILLGERIPLDVVNAQTGEIIIPANRQITRTLLRKMANVYDQLDIDPSPIREKIRKVIGQFEHKFAEELSLYENELLSVHKNTPAYKALLELEKRAETGDAQAQHELGLLYFAGTKFIKKNLEKAKALFGAAVKMGQIPSIAALGDCFAFENQHDEAANYYRRAAKKGDAHGQYRSSQLRSEENAINLLKLAAGQGHVEAQRGLGDRCAIGDGVEENKTEAVKWYRKAAERGDAEAQRKLGDCYYEGWIVSEDPKENIESYRNRQAVKWYRKAAEQGDVEAQKLLARCYASGVGVTQNETLAAQWYGKAGDSEAYEELGALYAEIGDKRKARRYYRKAGLNGWSYQIRALGPKNTW